MWRGLAAALLVACVTSVACLDFSALGGGDDATDGGADVGPCTAAQKMCAGTCFDVGDPNVGCSGDCTACIAPPNAQPACTLVGGSETCSLGACNPQYADCNSSSADGCETHTTTRASCGSCGNDCLQDFCERQGDAYVCSATCTSPNKVCGTGDAAECVDVTNDTANCGDCGISCEVENGNGTCTNAKCSVQCAAGYFYCGQDCALPTNQTCGASCGACVPGTLCDVGVGSPTYGTCVQGGAGGDSCTDGKCETDAGCVAPDQSPNCGSCGAVCKAGQKCCKGGLTVGGYSCQNPALTPDGGADPSCN